MKAIIIDGYGGVDQLHLRELPDPRPHGTYVTTLPTPSLFFWGGVQSIAGIFRNAKRAKGILVRPSGKDLAYLCQLADEGKLRPTVSLTLSLDRAAEAHEASEVGHTRGKIALEV